MPLIFPSNTLSAAGYTVDNSCRFNDDGYMEKTGSVGNQKTWTFSFWAKRAALGDPNVFFGVGDARLTCRFDPDVIQVYDYSPQYGITTNAVFKDESAWYNIVFNWDTTQAVASNRIKLWVNGVQITSFSFSAYPTLNYDSIVNSAVEHQVGGRENNSTERFNGYMAEVVLIDGLALTVSSFGEFNEDSPTIWQPIDVSGLTFGTNGFYLDFEDSANLGNDANGGTDLTETNLAAVDQATDSPSNNFCTLNPLWVSSNTYSEGNTEVAGGGAHRPNIPTMAASSGKWYMEGKLLSGNTNKWWIGYADQEFYDTVQNLTGNLNWGGGNTAGGTNQRNVAVNNGWSNQLNLYPNSDVTSFFSSSSVADDIIGLAVDLDGQKAWWSQNGVWRNGSATASTTFNASYPDTTQLDAGRNYYIGTGSEDSTWSVNYGNPSFTISSGNADGDGYGNFEFAPPSGFFSLCTKNLAEYG